MQAEFATIGMTTEAATRYRYEMELLADAQSRNIALSPQMLGNLVDLAGKMAAVETATKKLHGALDFSKAIVGGFVRDLRDGLKQGESFLKSFASASVKILDKLSEKLIDLVVEMVFINSLKNMLGGGLGGMAPIGSAITNLFSGLFAKGGVFDGPNAFARGGIVNSPTMFAFAKGGALGVMGEAGPEAVMPLARGPDGSLGVQVHGAANDNAGGPRQIVNVFNHAADTEVRTERSVNGDGTEIVNVIVEAVKKRMGNGEFDSVQRARFGNTPNRVVRG